jgi:hypothetical protein
MPKAQTMGAGRGDIFSEYLATYGTPLSSDRLRRQILPELDSAGLIQQKRNPDDTRETRVTLSPDAPPISNSDENTGLTGDQLERKIQEAMNWLKDPANRNDFAKFTKVFGREVAEVICKRNLAFIIQSANDPTEGSIILRQS